MRQTSELVDDDRMADRIDFLLAAAFARQREDDRLREVIASDLIVGAPRAPEYWYRRPRRGERAELRAALRAAATAHAIASGTNADDADSTADRTQAIPTNS